MFPKLRKKWLKNLDEFFLISEASIKLDSFLKNKLEWRNKIDFDSDEDEDFQLELYSKQNNSPEVSVEIKKNNFILYDNDKKIKDVN